MELDFEKLDGLIPVIVQDQQSKEVLMLGFMNREALAETVRCGEVVFYSRSRNRLWKKGEQSGHRLLARELLVDCDRDAIVVRVDALGPGVCHKGYASCFFRRMNADGSATTVAERTFDPAQVYEKEAR